MSTAHRAGTCATRYLLLAIALVLITVSVPAQDDGASRYVNFNFDRADIRLLVKLVGDMTGKRFVVDQDVKGQVTVVTPSQIPLADVYPLFLSVLESSGYSVVEKEDAFHVVPLPERVLPAGPVRIAGEEGEEQGVITKVIRLKHISAIDLKKILEPMVRGGKTGGIEAFGATNHLIVTDTAESIRNIERIVAELDKPGSARVAEVVYLEYASAIDVAHQLTLAMQGASSAGKKVSQHIMRAAGGKASLPTDAVVVPSPHANSLVLVGTPIQLGELKRIVHLLDGDALGGQGPLNAIFLKYLSAEEAAKSLNALLEKTQDKERSQRIAIEPNISNNALLVDAAPRDFEWVKNLVERLDQAPEQVLVEILIAEVGLGESLDLGFEWSTIENLSADHTTVIGRSRPGETDALMDIVTTSLFPQGLAIGVARGTYTDAAGNIVPRVPVLIRALAENRDLNILSCIPLWAQNNKEASVSVVENIPILRSTIEGGSGTARDVIQNIDRVDVGIKLKLTPHVNPNGEVLLELNTSIEAITDTGPADQPFTPTIAKREVSTTVTVPDKATVAISGLIREDRIKVVSKVPFLGDIPLLGHLFRSTSDAKRRTNLLILVTPHIVTDAREAAALKREWERRTSLPPMKLSFDGTPETKE